MLRVEIRFDDCCGNGKNSFAITGNVTRGNSGRDGDWLAGGCLHDDIAAIFPELAPLIRWHLFDDAGPMHYIANAVYLAGNRDHSGRLAGEPSAFVDVIQFGDVPNRVRVPKGLLPFLQELEIACDDDGKAAALVPIAVDGDRSGAFKFAPKWQYAGQMPLKWHECPFDSEEEAARFADSFINHAPTFHRMATAWSEGKERDLDGARRAACWPDATDAELCQDRDDLRAALEARLPARMAEFRDAVRGAGFYLTPADATEAGAGALART